MDVKFTAAPLGTALLWVGLIASLITIFGYVWSLRQPSNSAAKWTGRIGYGATVFGVLGMFLHLGYLVYNHRYIYKYVFEHTGNELTGWYRFAATWSGQEGSFSLWAAWTAIIGCLMLWKAGKYEARIMPFYVAILGFLCAILLKQSPFLLFPKPTPEMYATIPNLVFPFPNGQGLNPSLQNYWMTIHPPTIFFGFASLAVPFVYAIAAMLWRDYDGWAPRVMPYALLSTATLGGGLFMGGYWAYETQGWHGFWAWDPVENASFFPWLAITALAHGLVVQKSRGGMARTNTFLGFLSWSLFLVGTYLTRSGILGDLSVHAFADKGISWLPLLYTLMGLSFGGGLLLWIARCKEMPVRATTGDTLVSRDFAAFVSMLLMIVACVLVTIGTTQPIIRSWMRTAPWQPKAQFYNMSLLPLSMAAALFLGCAPWVAWRKTKTETFLKRVMIPWFVMLAFGFFMLYWVIGAERDLVAVFDPTDPSSTETLAGWFGSRALQRVSVVALSALGAFAALSNAMLAYRVFRAKPLSAGGWLAHVGMGLMMIGVIVSNTYERTVRVNIVQGMPAKDVFGYKIAFEQMTGKPMPGRPINPEYDYNNSVLLRVTPPDSEGVANDGTRTFMIAPRWFVHNRSRKDYEDEFERMRWPSIVKYAGHDLYVGLANDPGYAWPSGDGKEPGYTLAYKEKRKIGPYMIGYYDTYGEPGRLMGARIVIAPPPESLAQGSPSVIEARPALRMERGTDDKGAPTMHMTPVNVEVPELKGEDGSPGMIYLDKVDPATKAAHFRMALPGLPGRWEVPLEVTYKPWVNLVWVGVVVAVMGTLLAMLRRALEARRLVDAPEGRIPPVAMEAWEAPEE